MIKCTLFHTEGCHLCEEALAMLIQLLPEAEIELIDIVDDEETMTTYQYRIPVIKKIETGHELGWPFSQQQLQEFIA
ncbi:glutaredoxin family protein [Pseudoalteromonas sp. McH1-7]|uniref:glutaredoxin family protein n=1 Tax=Pseudoalteromonas TaxID=53246 RepID=UPI000FFE7CDF|nr:MULTISPECIES: glutaredoxin family protein [Pseudoalteromonas]MDW7548346.1 glutaredoxin family protein [Pseudoalteromonas peptidolytica]NLR14184.1 glutaredoxin family protein [Pseudoalteromonas peptidolytica]NUZ09379.1 glutaredoxin family protein [Pseudoalteromonas sp. McH1-7]RXF02322.1 glutaredoxin family protein [Pseudoalteromonas sp. PS5]USD27106.1 glutaredoxin family protein [Pseudoalteromonas sp. SCSIO 43201]